MDDDSDPRIYFAAERTLLAWLRTGIAVIGLGFLVARFGVFLMIVRGQMVEGNQRAASFIGIGFVLLGAMMIAASTWQHLIFTRTLNLKDRPAHYSITLSLSVAALVALSAVVLAVYLGISIREVPSSQ
jgi:putative membrane protein